MLLRFIRDINAPLNSIGDTALLISVRRGFYKITKKILAMNADVNKGCFFTDNPLHCAAFFQRKEYISYPVEVGGSVEKRNGLGETPLHVACYNSPEKEIMEKCLENNPYSYIMDHNGNIPFYTVVAEYNQKIVMTTELVELFLDRGLNVDAKDFRGRSPLHYCFRRSNSQIASIFLRNNAYLDLTTKHSVCLLKYIPTSLKTNEIGKIILKFIAMEICKGTPVNETLKERLSKREEADDYLEQCYQEINRLKSHRIEDTCVTYWKLLTKSIKQLARYTTNYLILEEIEAFDVDLYPIYSADILYKFEKGRKRMELMTECSVILNRFSEWKLPGHFINMVIDRLSIAEMENLIVAGVTDQHIL
ncbi:ankyrin-3-like [Coccinella septempunctata]|uniref:ankyrin-3-like n=1 Tax=Coccinella septempunctata TaxID=41139 RepID=UPI001D07E151|nr:ankyrin-3-like [Coccinella septempunctata]